MLFGFFVIKGDKYKRNEIYDFESDNLIDVSVVHSSQFTVRSWQFTVHSSQSTVHGWQATVVGSFLINH